MSDQELALNKTTPDSMRQIRVSARGTTDTAIPVGRVNSLYVVSDAACWLRARCGRMGRTRRHSITVPSS